MLFEPYHAAAYYSPETAAAYDAAGLTSGWAAYMAGRLAPLGPVRSPVATSLLFNFAPGLVASKVPACWAACPPDVAWDARVDGAHQTLRRLLGTAGVEPGAVSEAARLAQVAIDGTEVAGRPLFAAYLRVAWPSEPHLALWHASTLLREFRGDGHIAACVSHGLDGLAAHVTHAAAGFTSQQVVMSRRGWTAGDWNAKVTELQERELIDGDIRLTSAGEDLRRSVEEATDRAAAGPWRRLGDAGCEYLGAVMTALSTAIGRGGGLIGGNALGMPAWWEQDRPPS